MVNRYEEETPNLYQEMKLAENMIIMRLLSDIVLTTSDLKYTIELANDKIIGTDSIIRGYTINFLSHPFNIDLMPVELGSFNGDETLMIQGNRSDGYASIVASEQRAELFDRIGTLEQDNMRLRGMLGVESRELIVSGIVCRMLRGIYKTQFFTLRSSSFV
ncbi:hypothetical protein Tco_0399908 [Tanacetum coccineum]